MSVQQQIADVYQYGVGSMGFQTYELVDGKWLRVLGTWSMSSGGSERIFQQKKKSGTVEYDRSHLKG